MASTLLSNASTRLTYGPVDIHHAMDTVRDMGELQPEEGDPFLDGLPPQIKEALESITESINKVIEAIYKGLKGLLPEIELGEAADPALIQALVQYATIGLLIVLAGFVFYFILLQVKKMWRQKQSKRVAPILRTIDGHVLSSARSHMEKATELSNKNHYEAGTRELYLAMLCLLDENDVIPFEDNRSNLEYIQRIKALPAFDNDGAKNIENAEETKEEGNDTLPNFLKERFRHISKAFEGVRYGQKPSNAQNYQLCHEKIEQLFLRLKSQKTGGKR